MDTVCVAVSAAFVLAVLLAVVYCVASRRERGQDPHYAEEVYLYYDPATPAPNAQAVARALGATVATRSQVGVYAASGGAAHGYGVAGAGARVSYLGLTPAAGGLAATQFPGPAPPAVHGVWLYGPKPCRGTPYIEPFSGGGCGASGGCGDSGRGVCWFHPAGRPVHL